MAIARKLDRRLDFDFNFSAVAMFHVGNIIDDDAAKTERFFSASRIKRNGTNRC